MQPGLEVNRSPRCSAGVNNGQNYRRTHPSIVIMVYAGANVPFLPDRRQDIYTNIKLHDSFPCISSHLLIIIIIFIVFMKG
jgi:hypothetical protein